MKRFPRVASLLMVLPLAIAGLVASSGAASATVIVPPGQAGHTCSAYKYMDATHYWQTCAWADYQYVWFTVNFGNSSGSGWTVYLTFEDYIKAGVPMACPAGHQSNFYVPAHSVKGTDRLDCVLTRASGAYAGVGKVWYTSSQQNAIQQNSPTLQVQ